jgi:hypothetical protein
MRFLAEQVKKTSDRPVHVHELKALLRNTKSGGASNAKHHDAVRLHDIIQRAMGGTPGRQPGVGAALSCERQCPMTPLRGFPLRVRRQPCRPGQRSPRSA